MGCWRAAAPGPDRISPSGSLTSQQTEVSAACITGYLSSKSAVDAAQEPEVHSCYFAKRTRYAQRAMPCAGRSCAKVVLYGTCRLADRGLEVLWVTPLFIMA
jgi:hypothetical protein